MTTKPDRPTDILVIAALKMELDAFLTHIASRGGKLEEGTVDDVPVHSGTFETKAGKSLRIVAARPTRTGANAIAPLASMLATRLGPYALAMPGVCAGNPAEVALGDVVISEIAYNYDEGRRTGAGFEPDHRHVSINDRWLYIAQELSPLGLPSFGTSPPGADLDELLRAVTEGRDPVADLLIRRLTGDNPGSLLSKAERDGLLVLRGKNFRVTASGRAMLDQAYVYGEPAWTTFPFKVRAGPMASGNAVVKDGLAWDDLQIAGVRTVAALDMEAAAVAQVADRLEIPRWIVVKGVMDHADPRKNDKVKPFAARASAEVLLRFIEMVKWPAEAKDVASGQSVNKVGDVTGSGNSISQVFVRR